jgi:protein-tyrosine phosphatase
VFVRTSMDPIVVNQLSGADIPLPGRVGMTFAPGKSGPGSQRDLAADVDHLVDFWRTRWLVSLLEDEELGLLGLEGLLPAFEARGAGVVRFPIDEGGTPTFELAHEVTRFILASAARGENVVIHCRSGRGRTGMIAACTLVSQGIDPTRAVRNVRSARAGCIETLEQERFVYDFAAANPYSSVPITSASASW